MPDKGKFVQLIEEHQGLINKVVFLYADDSGDRRDLKQEIIGQAWGAFRNFRGESKFSTWLYRVALNTALSSLKRSSRQKEIKQTNASQEISHPRVENELIEMVLSVLNPIEKSIVLLLVEGYAQKEIAQVLGISDGNTRTKIHRIRNKLDEYGIKDLA